MVVWNSWGFKHGVYFVKSDNALSLQNVFGFCVFHWHLRNIWNDRYLIINPGTYFFLFNIMNKIVCQSQGQYQNIIQLRHSVNQIILVKLYRNIQFNYHSWYFTEYHRYHFWICIKIWRHIWNYNLSNTVTWIKLLAGIQMRSKIEDIVDG